MSRPAHEVNIAHYCVSVVDLTVLTYRDMLALFLSIVTVMSQVGLQQWIDLKVWWVLLVDPPVMEQPGAPVAGGRRDARAPSAKWV